VVQRDFWTSVYQAIDDRVSFALALLVSPEQIWPPRMTNVLRSPVLVALSTAKGGVKMPCYETYAASRSVGIILDPNGASAYG
jgi:hypothetical protein